MKKNIPSVILTLTIIIISGCDSPRDRRLSLSSSTSAVNAGSSTTGTNTNTGTTTTTTTPSTNTSTNAPTDISSNCSFSPDGTTSFTESTNHVGQYNMCKSTANDNIVYFQIKTAPSDTSGNSVQLCFIPMTTSNGSSIYIGNPMCGYFTANTIKKITFTKYSAYSNAAINSVMFFKDTSYYYSAFGAYTNTLTAFQACMNALYYGNATYCNSFKSTGQYVLKSF
jgi:hypothetical protein